MTMRKQDGTNPALVFNGEFFRIDDLSFTYDGTKLVFKSANESAEVYFESRQGIIDVHGFKISKVDHTNLVSKEEITITEPTIVNRGYTFDSTRRTVYHFLKKDPERQYLTLRLGLTEHAHLSSWSSLPHGFEKIPEPGFEEVFYYLLHKHKSSESSEPPKALQIVRGMSNDGSLINGVFSVGHKDFCVIPHGYHPVVGEPGVRVSYIWAYLAKKPEWEKL